VLLNKKKRGQYIGRLFKNTQSICLSADLLGGIHYGEECSFRNIVNFTTGKIDETSMENIEAVWCQSQSMYFYIKAVRSIK